KILVYGDYDVDGITSICLMLLTLKQLGANASYYMPHRVKDGYGLNMTAIKQAEKENVKLIITCDCGMDGSEEILLAKQKGIDTIIVDHHKAGVHIPPALAVINPKVCSYPFKELAGVGVVFKFAQVLQEKTCSPRRNIGTSRREELDFLEEHLDLVALGTVSDVVPLIGENRILVKYGLSKLDSSKKVGINALKNTAKINNKNITTRDIGFILGPRLNAGGRIDTADKCVKMLLSQCEQEALEIASLLEADNKQRQKIQEEICQEAMKMAEENVNFRENRILVLANEGWHPGVIGIVASRLVDKFSKPAILISLNNGIGRGSGRSIGDFNLFENLGKVKELLVTFGGHKHACGLEIAQDNIEPFRNKINSLAEELPIEEFTSLLVADAYMSLDILTDSVVKEFQLFSPFGLSNEEPVFITKNLQIMTEPKKVGSNHIKFWVKDEKFHREVIGFGKADYLNVLNKQDIIDLAYTAQIDGWENRNSVILKMEDVQ
ncbi:MAG: single-stranded-DNA-specific exonuclease RecJ, partial [Candidatus Omnitrophica bacterium]|nr:single-stranded-DNA-specific exonuclease RecJ [Candidatus Omnitrophota bacterium]